MCPLKPMLWGLIWSATLRTFVVQWSSTSVKSCSRWSDTQAGLDFRWSEKGIVLFKSDQAHLRQTVTLSGEATEWILFLRPIWKRAYSKRKEFAPFGSKFFPLRVGSFQKWSDLQDSKQEATKHAIFVKLALDLPGFVCKQTNRSNMLSYRNGGSVSSSLNITCGYRITI